jgi:hypothetical protein
MVRSCRINPRPLSNFVCVCGGGGGQPATPCASPPPLPSIFLIILFWIYHLIKQDYRHLLANAMASESQSHGSFLKENNGFFVVVDQTPRHPLSNFRTHFSEQILTLFAPPAEFSQNRWKEWNRFYDGRKVWDKNGGGMLRGRRKLQNRIQLKKR